MASIAEVTLWGQRVGALAYASDDRTATFEYAPGWLDEHIEIAPLTLPAGPGKFQFPHLPVETFKGLPGAFADTLPDDFGNAVINAWLARQGRSPLSFTAIDRLLYTGDRGIGALEYHPAFKHAVSRTQRLDLEALVSMAQQVLDQRNRLQETLSPASDQDPAMAALFQVGTSAGGARPKALIALNSDRSEVRSGQVPAPAGFEHYILKFDGVVEKASGSEVFGDPQGFGRMEYAYYRMAVAAGLRMSPCELLLDGPRAHFVTRRFDRQGNHKLHYQSLCALAHADYKRPGAFSYEELFDVGRRLRLPREDAIELYRRMVFNVVARNQDDHTKNTGFLLAGPKQPWRLAPAFDIAYSYKPDSPWVNAHQMSLNGKRDHFERADLLAIADQLRGFRKEATRIIEEVTQAVSEWRLFARDAGVDPTFIAEIQRHLRLELTK
jgi:serine/threonine-protein kinase HipA